MNGQNGNAKQNLPGAEEKPAFEEGTQVVAGGSMVMWPVDSERCMTSSEWLSVGELLLNSGPSSCKDKA